MQLVRPTDAAAFLELTEEFLLAREAEHNLILGIAHGLRSSGRAYAARPYFAVVEDGGTVVGAALRTPPYNVALTAFDDLGGLAPLVEDVRASYPDLPGALGPQAVVAEFVQLWGGEPRLELAERIYAAGTVVPPAGVPGRARPQAASDRPLLVAWMEAFADEAMPVTAPEPAAAMVDRRLADPAGGFLLWEDGGEVVSLAGWGGATPNGIRVGPVYTPPEHRGRGYGSAVTAEATERLLAGGRRFCFLFTDLANPTSNAIYQRIGYRPVADFDQWSLG